MIDILTQASQFLRNDPYVQMNGIKLISIDGTTALLEMIVKEPQCSFVGAAHGGSLFTLADTAFGLLANCSNLPVISVGIDTHMAFIKGCKVGDVIRAYANEVSRSKRIAVYRVDLSCRHETVGIFTGTVFITERCKKDFVHSP